MTLTETPDVPNIRMMQAMRKATGSVVTVAGCVILVAIAIGGCSKPGVRQTAISGEVRQVQSWRIAVDNIDEESTFLASTDIELQQSKYTKREYCTRYAQKVRSKLINEYDHTLAENFPQTGRIHLLLHSEKLALTVPPIDTTNIYDDISPAEQAKHGDSRINIVGAAASLFTDNDYVTSVTVRIEDFDGQLLGEILIGEEAESRVEPEFVAKVIDRVLRTGRYEGSKGMSGSIGGNILP